MSRRWRVPGAFVGCVALTWVVVGLALFCVSMAVAPEKGGVAAMGAFQIVAVVAWAGPYVLTAVVGAVVLVARELWDSRPRRVLVPERMDLRERETGVSIPTDRYRSSHDIYGWPRG